MMPAVALMQWSHSAQWLLLQMMMVLMLMPLHPSLLQLPPLEGAAVGTHQGEDLTPSLLG